MEIRIKTHEEFRADHLTIEITGSGAEVAEFAETRLPSRNLYTDEEVASLQASEAELVAGPLRRRIAELERTLAGAIDREAKLDEALVMAENKIRGYDTDRHTERDRADRITREHSACSGRLELREKDADTFRRQRNELETRVKELAADLYRSEQSVRSRDNLLGEATRKIEAVRDLLGHDQVTETRDKIVTTSGVYLADVIGQALDTLA